MDYEQFKQLVKEKDIDSMLMQMYLNDNGYVVVTQSQYDNLEVIDTKGDVP